MAVMLVIATLECSYYPHKKDPVPLNPTDWARLVCATLSSIACGYCKHYEKGIEPTLEKVRAEAVDPDPLSLAYPTLFYHVATTAEHIEGHVNPDMDMYQS